MVDVTQIKGERIFIAMARRTGKTVAAFRRALNANGNVVIVGATSAELSYFNTVALDEGLRILSSSLDRGTYQIDRKRIDVMTWARFESLAKQAHPFAGFGRIVEMIGLEPWCATDKQVELFNQNLARAASLVLMGTPAPGETGPHLANNLYHSGLWETYTVRMMDVPWHNPQVAADLIAQLGYERALCEVLAEVPKP